MLNLAVVGHTNTGKTSLMRTLLRDTQFGEVKNAAATTRHVEAAQIGEWVQLYDTPGLEDAGGVLDWLEENTSAQADGIERIAFFLNDTVAQNEFSQEAKVLRQLLNSDMALYVVDAREPVLPKYKDELQILSWCAKPIMPVFNFTQNVDLSKWNEMLARKSLHVSSSFDTVAFDFAGEMRLWDNLATMLPSRQLLDNLIATRQQEWQQLNQQAHEIIAHFLFDVAAFRQQFSDKNQLQAVMDNMNATVRQLERDTQQRLLSLYRFYQSELHSEDWALQAFRGDSFDVALLKEYGIRTTKGVAKGALIGLGFDVLTVGLSLGLGTAIGGVVGGALPNWRTLSDKLTGVQTIYIDAQTLTVLAARLLNLLAVLQSRGHAAQGELHFQAAVLPWQSDKLPEMLRKARWREKWSVLNGTASETAHNLRHEAAVALANLLLHRQ